MIFGSILEIKNWGLKFKRLDQTVVLWLGGCF